MAKPIGLHELITAVAGAVVEAQDQVELHQAEILGRYFDDKGRPKCLPLLLPSTASGSSETEGTPVALPFIAAFGANLLRITEVAIEFQVELGDLTVPAPRADMLGMPGAASGGPRVDVPDIGLPGTARLGLDPDKSDARSVTPTPRTSANLTVGLQPTSASSTTKTSIKMKVESQPQSEGLARLISRISQTF